ncbi:MAG: tetratricopeptide repeat protein [Rhodospirillales bacterium]|nr:tetratricopeptide repeat protein [Rhodospirillales bacterium]
MRTFALTTALLSSLVLAGPGVHAMGSDPAPAAPKAHTAQQDYAAGLQAIQSGQYDKGIESMKKVVAADPKNADAYNQLGFAYRKKGDVKGAGSAYETALKLNANHKGALEYQGELFLKINKMEDAMKNRERLVALCPTGCTELRELDRAIADHKASGGQST